MKRADVQYWDSCLLTSYICGSNKAFEDIIDELLTFQERGALTIVISSFVIAEVRSIPVSGEPGPEVGDEENVRTYSVDVQKWQRVQDLLRSEALDQYALTDKIASIAAGIGNQFPKLTPSDCTHIATAIHAKVDVLFTYDGASHKRRRPSDMIRYNQRIGTPPLKICEPYPSYGPIFDQR